jgi:Kef-type K+ transport system membrane component KefB
VTRIPVVVVEILLGSVAAYFGFLVENEIFKIIAKVGFLYLMFLAGMEVNLKAFGFEKKSLLRRTLIYFVMLYGCSLALFVYVDGIGQRIRQKRAVAGSGAEHRDHRRAGQYYGIDDSQRRS